MRNRIAIVGNGITAGLATYLFAPNNDITIFRPEKNMLSPIPELVPRRAFFNVITSSIDIEDEIVSQLDPMHLCYCKTA